MKYSFGIVVAVVVSIILISLTSCLEPTSSTPTAPMEPGAVKLPPPRKMPTDNSMCFICHMDFDEDPIVNDHIMHGITCSHCHGRSIAHMHDETLMTPPDILYGRTEVEAMCTHCHPIHHKDLEKVEVFRAKWLGKKRENGRGIQKDSVCTDCHGLHTIARR